MGSLIMWINSIVVRFITRGEGASGCEFDFCDA